MKFQSHTRNEIFCKTEEINQNGMIYKKKKLLKFLAISQGNIAMSLHFLINKGYWLSQISFGACFLFPDILLSFTVDPMALGEWNRKR